LKTGVVKVVSGGSGPPWKRCLTGSFILKTDEDSWIEIHDIYAISFFKADDPVEFLKNKDTLNRIQHLRQIYMGDFGRKKIDLEIDDDNMEIPKEKQCEYLTEHLQYLNEKIIQFFTLSIKIATAIVGGTFYLHLKLPHEDVKRASISSATDFLFILVSFSMILLILNNLRSWLEFRNIAQ